MASTGSPGLVWPVARFARFLRDFMPAQTLQLLFPLGSFLLFLGASYPWYRFPISQVSLDTLVNQPQVEDFIRSINAWAGWEQFAPELLVQLAFLASVVLWALPIRRVVSRFAAWVYLPASLAVIGYPVFLAATAGRRNAALDAFVSSAHLSASVTHSWLRLLGDGCYLTLAGMVVFSVALLLARLGSVSLPLRFRDVQTKESTVEISRDERDVFTLLIGATLWAVASSLVLTAPSALGRPLVWSGLFSIYEWIPALTTAAVSACIAFLVFREQASEAIRRLLRKQPLREYVLAVAIPLAVALLPRLVFEIMSKISIVVTPFDWSEILIPRPFPSILVVYVIALLEEFVLRGYLQTTLEKHFSLKRSIFLTALLWSLLPLGFGIAHSIGRGRLVGIPGISDLAWFATFILFSVPLGWLYTRTRSVLPVALMHGTIALFHLGGGYVLHINHPQLYWAELALWIVVGWYVMGERRYIVPRVQQ
jgi:membrane protease YdiL (CAAX protease family)